MLAAACSAFGMVRQAMTTLCPAVVSADAVAAPTPLLPPVTMTFTRRSSSLCDSREVDLGDAVDLEHALLCDCCTPQVRVDFNRALRRRHSPGGYLHALQ